MTYHSSIKIFNNVPWKLTTLGNEEAHFKLAVQKRLNTQVDSLLLYFNHTEVKVYLGFLSFSVL
jgi:hypothetical protein